MPSYSPAWPHNDIQEIFPNIFFVTGTNKTYYNGVDLQHIPHEEQGFFGSASISNVWKQTCNVNVSDFIKLTSFSFRHLLSAHGVPLLNDAYVRLTESIKRGFNL